MPSQRIYDYVIVGSGAASVPAALVVREAGKRVLIIEKTELFGGSTALSGGVAWLPLNPVGRRAGVIDSFDMAQTYLDACSEDGGKGCTPQRREAFLRQSPRMVAFLERQGMKFIHPEGYSDYYEGEKPGGVARSRSLIAEVFDLRQLGSWAEKFRAPAGLPPIRMSEFSALTLNGRTLKSKVAMARVGVRMTLNKLGARLVGMGASLQGRLLKLALDAGVDIELNCSAEAFIVDRGRITGVRARQGDQVLEIIAHEGVLIDAGGFARNQGMREAYLPSPSHTENSLSNPGDTGDLIRMAQAQGADIDTMDLGWWVITSKMPGGRTPTHTADMTKPHAIMVDQSGQRFVNESTSYVDVGKAMYQRNAVVPAIPSWIILDSRHRDRYRWGGVKPGKPPKAWTDSGYMIEAGSLAELARKCGIDAAGLQATVERFNGFARTGVDKDFGRGVGGFHRFLGDPTHRPNPNLGTLEQPPFYAVAVQPGDVGTGGGLVTDESGRVLRPDGSVIEGLYATGNSAASLVGRGYPGAGSTIGPAMVFGYIAARHAMRRNAEDADSPTSLAA